MNEALAAVWLLQHTQRKFQGKKHGLIPFRWHCPSHITPDEDIRGQSSAPGDSLLSSANASVALVGKLIEVAAGDVASLERERVS